MDTGHNDHLNFELFEAAKNGCCKKFAKLASHSKTILSFGTSHRKDTLLHIAAVYGHHELTQDIANQFPDLLISKNIFGDTPLHVAARTGMLLVVKSLLTVKDGSNIDNLLAVANKQGNKPLHEAVIHNQDGVVEFLLGKIRHLTNDVVLNFNKKGKSPLYLAVESGDAAIVNSILKLSGVTSQFEDVGTKRSHLNAAILGIKITDVETGNAENSNRISDPSSSSGSGTTKSVLHVAVAGKDIGILRMVAEKVLVRALPDNNNHLLHIAASLGFLDGVKYLLDKFGMDVLRHDDDGFCPIHLASKNGHLQVTKALLDHYPDAREFLSNQHQNILHVAAENGKDKIVQYLLETKWAEFLINEKDKDGYTPLHLATKYWHPKVVSALTWDPRVDLKQVNEEGLTALEVAEKYMEVMAPFKKRLTWIALRSAGTPRAHIEDPETVKRLEAAKYEPYNMDYCKSRVNTLLLVSALVATVTFAAGFTMPGGYNSSASQHLGMASMLHKIRFRLFVICDSLAVYSSIIVTVMLMWAQLGDLNLMLNALRKAQRLLGVSLAMMSLAFLSGVNLVVTESHKLSILLLVMGILSLIILLAFFIPLFLPYTSRFIILRYISYYPFKGLMLAS